MKKLFIVLLFAAVFISCGKDNFIENIAEIPLLSLNGDKKMLPKIEENNFYVIVFFSHECPLCINYTYSINEIFNNWADSKFHFYIIFSGIYHDAEDVRFFRSKYQLQANILLDRENKLAGALNARVTPEVFVLNDAGYILYQGAIDNRMPKLGVKRTEITAFYLKSTLQSLSNNKPLNHKKTEAVGCLIEY